MGRKTLLTVQQRVDILKELEESSIAYVAGKYNVHPKTIKRIQKCAAEINSFAEKGHLEKRRKNLKLPRFDELEQRLSVWFAERRAMGDTLSDVLLLEKAGELKEELESCSNFKVSAGWLAKFKRRHHIRLVHIYGEKVSANENDLTICSEQEQRLSGTFEERTAEEGDEETAIEEEDEERAAEEKDQENGLKLHPRIRKDFEDVFKDLEHLKKYIPHSAQCHVDGLKLTVLGNTTSMKREPP